MKYTILGAWDSDPENNILSYLTPLAQKILGKKAGENVEIDIEGNEQSLVIEGVSRWVDQK
jgi:transcription elongation GreA/GreB family factor